MISQTLDPAFIEHDAYILFDKMMRYAKPWYEFNERIVTKGNRNVSFFLFYMFENNSTGFFFVYNTNNNNNNNKLYIIIERKIESCGVVMSTYPSSISTKY